ncbi:MAG: LytTR family DNA-binding domain-containing protein [Woeseiaceae bacterium]|nr:LytTR family DNA-binding domain-containing protein [Woeseiaceae bacterium]
MKDLRAGTRWSRRLLEAGLLALLLAVLWTFDTLSKLHTAEVIGIDLDHFRLVTNQVTSAVAVFLLVPAVAWWLTRFPIRRDGLWSAAAGLIIGSMLFAAAHYFLLTGLRYLVYSLGGRVFVFSDLWVSNLLIEYQKDVKIYLAIVAIISVYRYYRRHEADQVSARPDRLIVQTGGGEKIIRKDDIEYLEAARNYVVVGTGAKEYLLRDTLSNLEKSLAPDAIARTHRSYLVNIDRIDEICTTDAGSHEIMMQSGKRIPLSRGYREHFKSRIVS